MGVTHPFFFCCFFILRGVKEILLGILILLINFKKVFL
ncbi:hypothetical protein FDF50_01330 [Clostridium botulinum]|uniref:Uncharacterized protein n=1 Tax=Clostridium botulinum TaxID=1491 RepID=A0AA43Y4Y5_CLOBO|nr:hypothetical protein [Clostridium botulinum]NFK37248.1 hypothetical protein [Clostridium botulinum H04402 065]NFP91088.1 hypothetical protein [Clostridium sporogenes]MBN3441543.1 hypothetical protein [Clostridium botulinum]MBO0573391.1 hypothetical protein [Clostridium botulinum]